MHIYKYFPPSPEEQRSFAVFVGGSALAVAIAFGLIFFAREMGQRMLLLGGALAILWKLAQASWEFEARGQRAKTAQIGVSDTGLEITDSRGKVQSLTWKEIQDVKVVGGRLHLKWADGSFTVGSREVQDGMVMTQEILRRLSKPEKPSNFIPLEPK